MKRFTSFLAGVLLCTSVLADGLIINGTSVHLKPRDVGSWNEKNLGVGYESGFYQFAAYGVLRDSENHWSLYVGKGRRFRYNDNVYIGYTYGLTTRIHGVVPYVLPLATLRFSNHSVNMTYVPEVRVGEAATVPTYFFQYRYQLNRN